MRGWLSVMIPIGYITWRKTASIPATIGAFLAAPLFAIFQGTVEILLFRYKFGDAPLPHSPAHGVVVVHPNNTSSSCTAAALSMTSSCSVNKRDDEHKWNGIGCQCVGGRRWRNTTLISVEDRLLLQKALQEPPLRLLVIGDSLAIGVGMSASCTPLLPEVIARSLSKAFNGRAVYWTCHGAPGASAGWIVRELERGIQSKPSPPLPKQNSISETDSSEDESSSSSDEEDEEELPQEWQEWRDRLHRHKKRFHPDVLGPYDICVVLTGSNDLKSAFFPFLLTGEDVDFRKQAKERGGNYAKELRRVFEVLQQRMRSRMDDFQQRVRQDMQEIRHTIMERLHSSQNSPRSRAHSTDSINNESSSLFCDDTNYSKTGPIIVLPGMPARSLPIFRLIPLRWLAIPIIDIMDSHKRALAKAHPDDVIFVEPPSVESITEFENQRGPIWKQRETEDTLLALRDIRKSTCIRIESTMKEYYAKRGQDMSCVKSDGTQFNAPIPPLSERPGTPGSKIISVDNVHPNDEGYDFWGRCIASAVVAQWKQQQDEGGISECR